MLRCCCAQHLVTSKSTGEYLFFSVIKTHERLRAFETPLSQICRVKWIDLSTIRFSLVPWLSLFHWSSHMRVLASHVFVLRIIFAHLRKRLFFATFLWNNFFQLKQSECRSFHDFFRKVNTFFNSSLQGCKFKTNR